MARFTNELASSGMQLIPPAMPMAGDCPHHGQKPVEPIDSVKTGIVIQSEYELRTAQRRPDIDCTPLPFVPNDHDNFDMVQIRDRQLKKQFIKKPIAVCIGCGDDNGNWGRTLAWHPAPYCLRAPGSR